MRKLLILPTGSSSTLALALLACLACARSTAQQLDWFVVAQPALSDPRIFTMTVDPAGNLYTAGDMYAGDDMDPGPGVVPGSLTGGLVRELDADGIYQWGVGFEEMEPGSYCRAEDIRIDALGNIIIVGKFEETIDFDPSSAQALRTSSITSWNTFVCKLDPTGNLLWVADLPHTGWNTRVTTDLANNIWVAGMLQHAADFDPGPGDHTLTPSGGAGFLWKLDPAGNLAWSGLLDGTDDVLVTGVAVNANGELFAAGYSYGATDLDPGAGVHPSTLRRFVIKLQANGDLDWAAELPHDYALGLALDGEGNVIVSGTDLGFDGPYDFDPGPGTYELPGAQTPFLWKLSPEGELIWVRVFGDTGHSTEGVWVTTDAANNVIVSGRAYGNLDLDPGPGSVLPPNTPAHNFISVLDAQGSFLWGDFINHDDYQIDDDAGRNWAWIPATDAAGDIYVGGYAWGTMDFDPGAGQAIITNDVLDFGQHLISGFVVKLTGAPTVVTETPDATFTIYPVPVQNVLHIATDERILRASLLEMSGKLVRTFPAAASVLDVHDLPSGAYLLEVVTAKGRSARMVVKE